jgi:hypothetical protein
MSEIFNIDPASIEEDIGPPSSFIPNEDGLATFSEIENLSRVTMYFLDMGPEKYEVHRVYHQVLSKSLDTCTFPDAAIIKCNCYECTRNMSLLRYDISQKVGCGNVYLMGNRRNRYVKIGFTRGNPTFREKTLQAEEPEIELICYWPGTMADEKRLHSEYSHRRLRGEWFSLTAEETIEIGRKYFGVSI